jgi:hypothetical protein
VTGLTVVVANRASASDQVRAGATALVGELDPESDQVVWVDSGGLAPPLSWPSLVTVAAPARASRGVSYRLGLDVSKGLLVAFTDSSTAVEPGWRDAALAALETGSGVTGGPVLPSGPRSMASWAGFLVDYGAHAVPPYRSASGDVSGNNVAYRRELLPAGPVPIWKSEVNASLAARGIRPTLAPGMRVVAHRQYRWRDLARGRVPSGALYGTQRSASWGEGRRLAAALGCAGLPAVALCRTWARLAGQPQLQRRFLASLPAVLTATMAWSAGEATGYLFRREDGSRVW